MRRVAFCLTNQKSNNNEHVQLSAQKKESGELSILHRLGLPVQITLQMDIYAYHLEHPDLSQWQVSLIFNVSKSTVNRAYQFMSQLV